MNVEELTVGSAERIYRNLSDWLRQEAEPAPQASALESPDRIFCSAELLRVVQDRSRYHGVGADDRVAIAATRSPETIISILATVDACIGYVPLDLGYPPSRFKAMPEDARPRVVLEPHSLVRV